MNSDEKLSIVIMVTTTISQLPYATLDQRKRAKVLVNQLIQMMEDTPDIGIQYYMDRALDVCELLMKDFVQ